MARFNLMVEDDYCDENRLTVTVAAHGSHYPEDSEVIQRLARLWSCDPASIELGDWTEDDTYKLTRSCHVVIGGVR